MKLKKALFMMVIAVVGILGMTTVSAATISDNGQYSLVLTVNDENGDIDGAIENYEKCIYRYSFIRS